jgi:glutathione S-transferase
MKVHDYAGFPNPLRVRIALAEKGATTRVQFVHVDVPAGAARTPAFLALNPAGAVPVLELDDGTTISECTAITEYLDHAFGPPTLTGRDGRERAVVQMMQRRAEQMVLDAVAAYFHHATPGLGPALETAQNPSWGQAQRARAEAGLRYFDGVLATQPYVAGDTFTMADITLHAGIVFAQMVGVGLPDGCAALARWRQHVLDRPAVQAAHA